MIIANPANLEAARSIDTTKVAPGDELKISLNISVAKDVRAILVTEILPLGLDVITSEPKFGKFNKTDGRVAWLFYSTTEIGNKTITYTAKVSNDMSEGVYNITGAWSAINATGVSSGDYSFTEFQVEKLNSTLSLSVSSQKVKIDETINISGSVSPALSNLNITLTYVKSDGSIFKQIVTTSSDGKFIDTYKTNATGSWSVTASWLGNTRYKGAESHGVAFAVESPIWEWLTYAVIFIVPILVIGIVIFLRKRKTQTLSRDSFLSGSSA
jgi:hypothetical protein